MAEDRNQSVKNQLLKKRDEAARRKIALAPGEMVDDAVARGVSSGLGWLRKNFGIVQWFIVGAVVLGIGYAVYDGRATHRAEAATSELVKAVESERGRVAGTSGKSPDEGADDPTPLFKSADERRDTALASYRKVASSYPGTGAAILARMGEAGIALDKHDYDGALAAYREVKDSPLAKADVSVRGRALEGIGLSLEQKGDTEGALKSFRELENTDVTGLKELGMYHQARLYFAKNESDKAKELLTKAREKLKAVSPSGGSANPMMGPSRPFAFLESQVDDLLKRIDPSAVVASPAAGEGLTQEKLMQLQEQLKRSMSEAKSKTPPAPPAGSQ